MSTTERAPDHLVLWFCTLCREDVQIGKVPTQGCPSCHSINDLQPIQVPYVPGDSVLTADQLMTTVRWAVDGYTLGKWTLGYAGSIITDGMERYVRSGGAL